MNALSIPLQNSFHNSSANFSIQWSGQSLPVFSMPFSGSTKTDLINASNVNIDNRSSVSNDVFSLGPNSSNVNIQAGDGTDVFEYLNGRGTKNTVLNGGAGLDTLRINANDTDLMNDLRQSNASFVQYNNGFGLRGADGQEVKVLNTEQISFNNRTYNLQSSADVQQLVAALKGNPCDPCQKPIPIIDERNKTSNCGCPAPYKGAPVQFRLVPVGLSSSNNSFQGFRNAGNFGLDLSNSNNYLVFNNNNLDSVYSSPNASYNQGFQPQLQYNNIEGLLSAAFSSLTQNNASSAYYSGYQTPFYGNRSQHQLQGIANISFGFDY